MINYLFLSYCDRIILNFCLFSRTATTLFLEIIDLCVVNRGKYFRFNLKITVMLLKYKYIMKEPYYLPLKIISRLL